MQWMARQPYKTSFSNTMEAVQTFGRKVCILINQSIHLMNQSVLYIDGCIIKFNRSIGIITIYIYKKNNNTKYYHLLSTTSNIRNSTIIHLWTFDSIRFNSILFFFLLVANRPEQKKTIKDKLFNNY